MLYHSHRCFFVHGILFRCICSRGNPIHGDETYRSLRNLMFIIVAALATWQIVEIWRHSKLMASLRSRTEMWDNFLGELLSCPFCLSVWVSLFCMLGLELSDWGLAGYILSLMIYALAVSRLANLGNDVFKQFCLTPRISVNFKETEDL